MTNQQGQTSSRLQNKEESPLPLPGTVYYPTNLLTRRPQPLETIALEKTEGVQPVVSGKIRLKIWINASGAVTDAIVDGSELPGIITKQAQAVFLHTRFTPGEYFGQKVAVVMTIEVSYEDFLQR